MFTGSWISRQRKTEKRTQRSYGNIATTVDNRCRGVRWGAEAAEMLSGRLITEVELSDSKRWQGPPGITPCRRSRKCWSRSSSRRGLQRVHVVDMQRHILRHRAAQACKDDRQLGSVPEFSARKAGPSERDGVAKDILKNVRATISSWQTCPIFNKNVSPRNTTCCGTWTSPSR